MSRDARTACSVLSLVIVVLAIEKGGVLVRTAFSMKCLTSSTWNPNP